MRLKCCCSDCTEKMHYNVKLKMLCISGKCFLHSGFWHLPKYKIQKPHEVFVQWGHHFPLTMWKLRLETKSSPCSCLMVFLQQLYRGTSEKDKSTGKGHMAVGNLCLLGQDLTVLVQLVFYYLYMAMGWCQLMSSQLRAQAEKCGVFTCLCRCCLSPLLLRNLKSTLK